MKGLRSELSELAGTQGFEPRYADPESAVLPLDDVPTYSFSISKGNTGNPCSGSATTKGTAVREVCFTLRRVNSILRIAKTNPPCAHESRLHYLRYVADISTEVTLLHPFATSGTRGCQGTITETGNIRTRFG